MRTRWMLLTRRAILAGALSFALVVGAAAYEEGDILVYNAWATPTPAAQADNEDHDHSESTGEADHHHAEATTEAHHMDATAETDHDEAGAEHEHSDPVGAVYVTIENGGSHPIRLIEASTPAAAHLNLAMRMADGETHEVTDGILIGEGETFDLTPSGYYLAVVDPSSPLEAGAAIAVSLTFEMVDSDSEPLTIVTGALVSEEAPEMGDLVVSGAWARQTAPAELPNPTMDRLTVSTYLTIENRGSGAAQLLGVTAPAAAAVELHTTALADNMAAMNAIDVFEIPAGEARAFTPGADHLMLVGLAADLFEGDAFPLTLTFENGDVITIAVPVYDALLGMDAPGHNH